MTIAPNGSLRPALATSMTHPSPLKYVYTIRRNVRFWNGNVLTAADVANALNYYRFPGSVAAAAFGGTVRSIKATGRYTVAVILKRPDAAWPYVPANFALGIFEKKFADANKGTMGRPGVLTMGTGPWRFDSLDPSRGVELSANDRYWGGRQQIRRLSIRFFSDQNSMALALRAGEVDTALQFFDRRAFESVSGSSRLVSVPSANAGIFAMNTRVAPWSDVHVRRAVAYALNRTDLITAAGGYRTSVTTLIPKLLLRSLGSQSAVDKLLRSLPQYPHSVARARQEMAQSAYRNGFTATIPAYTLPAVSQAIAAQLDEIGITLKLDSLSANAWVAEALDPSKRRPVYMTAGAASPDPGQSFGYLLGSKNAQQGGFNVANYAPRAVDDLIKKGAQTTNPAERLAVYGALLRRLALDVPYVALHLRQVHLALSPDLSWPTFDAFWLARTWATEIKPQ